MVAGHAEAAAVLGLPPQLIFNPFPPQQFNVEIVEYRLTDFSQRWAGGVW
jgi:hypothetical protein